MERIIINLFGHQPSRQQCIGTLITLFCVITSHMGQQQYNPSIKKPDVFQGEMLQPLRKETHAVISCKKSSCLKGPKKEILFRSMIHQAADRHQVDPALIKAIIMAESGYNPSAVSKKGAKGLMQLMPTTAQELGVEDIFNPEHNIDGGVIYFKRLLNRFNGNVKFAVAAYNAGSRNVRQYQGVPPFKATQCYVKKVFKYYDYYKEQTQGQFTETKWEHGHVRDI